MNPLVWLLLLGGGAYYVSKLSETGSKISISVTGINMPKLKNGSLIISANVAIDNPTDYVIVIKKPYLKAFYNGAAIGNSLPSSEKVQIKANDRTTIKDMNIQIPISNLPGIVATLLTGKIPKLSLDVEVSTEVNGVPYSSKQHFEL